jgi:hypothetical protein
MPLTPAEIAEYDQGLAKVDADVTRMAAVRRKWAARHGEDQALTWMYERLTGSQTREELALALVVALSRIPEDEL